MPLNTNLKNLAPSRVQFKRTIQLLSHGYACPKAFPDGMVTVYPWDSNISDWLIDQRKKGVLTRQITSGLVSQLVELNGCPLGKFVLGDVTTVLMVARSIARENKVIFSAPCPNCGHVNHEELNIPDQLVKVGEKSQAYPGYDSITLPVCKDVVQIRPLLIEDEEKIYNRHQDPKEGMVKMSDRVATIITAIMTVGGSSADSIKELFTWFNALPPADQQYLEDQEVELTPHLDQNVPLMCDECEKEFKHSLNLNDDFFR